MNKVYKTAIVGGGASGLLCAVELLSGCRALKGDEVVVLEGNDRVGKKLIATGNGQGNLTNANMGKEFYHGDEKIIQAFINQQKSIDLKQYLYNLGIPLTADDNGRIYPLSKQASAVLDVLRAFLERAGAITKTSFKVNKIEKKDGVFVISNGNEKVFAQNVVCAFGGTAGKQFGTDGSAYSLVFPFSHTLTKTYPSLVQIKTDLESIRGLKGLKEYAKISVYDGQRLLKQAEGDILFTEYGISGNAVFMVSGYLVDAKKPIISIEFLPRLTSERVLKILQDKSKNASYSSIGLLDCILNKRIGIAVIKSAKSNKLTDVVNAIKHFKLVYKGTTGFNNAQVTKGGIDCKDVDENSYESKRQKGLYVVGEALNVDGDCGGYNLTFAFVSGIVCARDIKNNNK